jgi:amidase
VAIADSATDTDLAFAGLAGQAERVRSGDVSSRELTELTLRRIRRLDQYVNAFRITLDDSALAEADQADARRRAGDDRPLLGVPVAVKDDQDVRGEITGKGTLGNPTPKAADSEIVRRLRAAGAVIVGKTLVPELQMFPWSESMAYGAVRNPWDLDRTPGGSSGGSSAAVAAGMVAAATASDGAGSIRIPAGCTGLVGLKTQRGRVSIAPDTSGWHGMSVYGTVTRTVADTALFYDAVKDSGPSFAEAAAREPGKLRIAISMGIPKGGIVAKVSSEYRGAVESTAETLRSLGHEVQERELDYGTVINAIIARYLRGIHADAQSLEHPERLAKAGRGLSRTGGLIPEAALRKAIARSGADAARINRVYDEGFDLVLTPMFTSRPPRVLQYEGRGGLWSFNAAARFTPFTAAWNHLGQPAIALPAAPAADGFPLAVQFLAPPDGEPVLLSLAAQLEAALDWPSRRPTLPA